MGLVFACVGVCAFEELLLTWKSDWIKWLLTSTTSLRRQFSLSFSQTPVLIEINEDILPMAFTLYDIFNRRWAAVFPLRRLHVYKMWYWMDKQNPTKGKKYKLTLFLVWVLLVKRTAAAGVCWKLKCAHAIHLQLEKNTAKLLQTFLHLIFFARSLSLPLICCLCALAITSIFKMS